MSGHTEIMLSLLLVCSCTSIYSITSQQLADDDRMLPIMSVVFKPLLQHDATVRQDPFPLVNQLKASMQRTTTNSPGGSSGIAELSCIPRMAEDRLFQSAISDCTHTVVYTAIFGRYDPLQPLPVPASNRTCYIALMDAASLLNEPSRQYHGMSISAKGWRVFLVDSTNTTGQLSTSTVFKARVATRLVKLLGQFLFPRAEWLIWLDAKYKLLHDGNVFAQKATGVSADLMMLNHKHMTSAYENLIISVFYHKIGFEDGVEQLLDMVATGHSAKRNGNPNAGLIVRRGGVRGVMFMTCLWYHQYLKFPVRDQIAFGQIRDLLQFEPSPVPSVWSALSHFTRSMENTKLSVAYHSPLMSSRLQLLSYKDFFEHVQIINNHITAEQRNTCPCHLYPPEKAARIR